MITDDDARTAAAIAGRVGILDGGDDRARARAGRT
jgi:hypothetical protein